MSYNTRNYETLGGSTWVVTGNLEVPSTGIIEIETGGSLDVKSGGNQNVDSGGYINVSSGGQIAIPVTSSSSNDAPIPNEGLCIISAAGATASDCRTVAAPTRAGLTLNLVSNCAASGCNVCVASATSLVDIVILDESQNPEPIWHLVKGSSQNARFVSVNTSQWQVLGPIAGTLSTAGST